MGKAYDISIITPGGDEWLYRNSIDVCWPQNDELLAFTSADVRYIVYIGGGNLIAKEVQHA
jgi:hypothetical protein